MKKLISFLRLKYSEFLQKHKKTSFSDYYPYTDKKINLNAEMTLSTVPFFDGLYILSADIDFNNALSDIINEYNQINSEVKFVEKQIEKNHKRIINVREFENFLVMHEWFTKESNLYYIKDLFRIAGLELNPEKLQSESEYNKYVETFRLKLFDYILAQDLDSTKKICEHIQARMILFE